MLKEPHEDFVLRIDVSDPKIEIHGQYEIFQIVGGKIVLGYTSDSLFHEGLLKELPKPIWAVKAVREDTGKYSFNWRSAFMRNDEEVVQEFERCVLPILLENDFRIAKAGAEYLENYGIRLLEDMTDAVADILSLVKQLEIFFSITPATEETLSAANISAYADLVNEIDRQFGDI